MARLFGTDGIRGVANTQLTCQTAYRLGQAAVLWLGRTIVIGKDTRLSGDMLEAAVAAGVMSAGGTVLAAGVIPTPGVAFLVRKLRANGGVVISASHNPPEYNGLKLFDADGFKLPDALEDEMESFIVSGGLEAQVAHGEAELPSGAEVGIVVPVENAARLYVDHAVTCVRSLGVDFSGLHIALDVGHGASAVSSASAFEKLGAKVSVLNGDYDGTDINVGCGSTCLEPVKQLVAQAEADVGVAHDGDADRVMLVAPDGTEIDGDFMAAFLARDMSERGVLAGNTVVSTVMCNVGFVHAMREAGIQVLKADVGDRYVLEKMREGGFNLGGEQSGHMILLDHNTTGDGLLTACLYLAAVVRAGVDVNEAARIMVRFPQVLVNVADVNKEALAENAAVSDAIAKAKAELGEDGNVLVRPSGTEPVIRVMVEAPTQEAARSMADRIAAVIASELAV